MCFDFVSLHFLLCNTHIKGGRYLYGRQTVASGDTYEIQVDTTTNYCAFVLTQRNYNQDTWLGMGIGGDYTEPSSAKMNGNYM